MKRPPGSVGASSSQQRLGVHLTVVLLFEPARVNLCEAEFLGDHCVVIHLMGVHRQGPPGRLMPSFGSVGDAFDNAMMESFWSTMQTELLDRKHWKTRVELSNAIFEFIEVSFNRRRRHSQLGYISPIEFERTMTQSA